MNSWGEKWADGGFFRVRDENILTNTLFYDVYWTQEELLPSEIKAFEKECIKRAKEHLHRFPSIQSILHKCPTCNERSELGQYYGHILEAECPKCHQKFKPTNEELLQSLYTQTPLPSPIGLRRPQRQGELGMFEHIRRTALESRIKCPNCNEISKLGQYFGHILEGEAECPKCHLKFKPTDEELCSIL
jgi:Zn ribbon nucleic-acid-binding protein